MLLIFIFVLDVVILLVYVYFSFSSVSVIFFFKQKTAYEMRISDWSSDVCSSDLQYEVDVANRTQVFRNTNLLVRKPDWDIKVSKTGYINEAGECLVMLARINGRDVAMVLLDSQGKLSRIGDAVRLRRILQSDVAMAML